MFLGEKMPETGREEDGRGTDCHSMCSFTVFSENIIR
jgi:hypothetical protein